MVTGKNVCNYGLVSDKGVFDLNWRACHAGFRDLTSKYAKDEQGKRDVLNVKWSWYSKTYSRRKPLTKKLV
jgi:hypothetical protein